MSNSRHSLSEIGALTCEFYQILWCNIWKFGKYIEMKYLIMIKEINYFIKYYSIWKFINYIDYVSNK